MGLAVVCPIINTDRKNPFHVPVDSDKLTGFVMSEQVKSIDYKTFVGEQNDYYTLFMVLLFFEFGITSLIFQVRSKNTN
jgi:hypothetical protein